MGIYEHIYQNLLVSRVSHPLHNKVENKFADHSIGLAGGNKVEIIAHQEGLVLVRNAAGFRSKHMEDPSIPN